MKKLVILIVIFALIFTLTVSAEGKTVGVTDASPSARTLDFEFKAKSVILMEASTGTVIYAKNEHEALPPASVTKIMTLLLVAEAIKNGQIKSNFL